MADLIARKYYQEGLAYYEARAEREIRENRMGELSVTLTDKAGRPLCGKSIRLIHKTHDFDFGCNFFMKDQYDTAEENERYEEKWKRLFNTAVVPLYWEGTEPSRGYLRYGADAPNDIYRRPSPQKVVDWAKENGVRLKGHPLFWHEFIPDWLPQDWEELYPLIEKRFQEISEHFAHQIPVFDCVNEPARIWNVHQEHLHDDWKHIIPPKDYVKIIFDLARKYFPDNALILNEAVGAAFTEFHGRYGGYYLNIKDLLSRGVSIDRIGLQCHTYSAPAFQNIYNGEKLFDIFDIYGEFDKPLVLSEISVPSVFDDVKDEEFQAQAASMLYRICFAHKRMSGLFWWNLPDDGILTTKRTALGENLPSAGLIDGDYREKPAYWEIDRLINKEWRTDVTLITDNEGKANFCGFYGTYEVTLENSKTSVHLGSDDKEQILKI